MIEICHQWAKRFITLFGKYQKNSWNWFLFFPNLFGVYTFMKIYIFPNQNLYLEYRYAALNNIAIDLICRFLLGRPIPRAAFYICSMYKWLTSSVSDGSINQIRFFIFFSWNWFDDFFGLWASIYLNFFRETKNWLSASAITMSLVQGFHFLARKRPEAAGTMVSLKRPGSSFVPWWKAEAVTLAL